MKRIVVAGVSGAIGGALAESLLARDEKSLVVGLCRDTAKVPELLRSHGRLTLLTWDAYRSSKAALNMLVRTLSVELPRRCKPIACVSLHPGTTDSALSDPFRQSLAQLQVHSVTETAGNLLKVIEGMTSEDNGRFLSWDGSELPW